jgi:hypothetical protein
MQHRTESQLSLPGPSTKGEERGHTFKLHDSSCPLIAEKASVKSFFSWPPHSHKARGIDRQKVDTNDGDGRLADDLPL